MSSQCRIHLENYTGTYYPGSPIVGRVECYFDDECTLRGIKIRVKCEEHNEWLDSEEYLDPSDNKYKSRDVLYTGDKDVIYMEQMLYGSDSGSMGLSRGKHVFPFSFNLPEKLPSTFNGPYGSVRYKMKAIVDRPMRTDYEDQFIFVVMAPVNLNTLSDDCFQPVNYSDDKTVCCWCCAGGNITMDVELPKRAFAVGEVVNFRITISNLSNENVESLKVVLNKHINFKVTDPSWKSKATVDPILTFDEHGVGAHGEHTYDLEMTIPEYLEAPNFALCTLFDVTYDLIVTAKTGSCSTDLSTTVYPEIGHIQKGQLPSYPQNDQHYPSNNGTYPSSVGGPYSPLPSNIANYPPPQEGTYGPPPGGAYPPPIGATYPPPPGAYPPPPETTHLPPPGGAYPPPIGAAYPSPTGGAYPPPTGGAYPPPTGGVSYPPGVGYLPSSGGGPPPGPSPYAPTPFLPPGDKGQEAGSALSTPSAPSFELPPPSYNEIQKTPYLPK